VNPEAGDFAVPRDSPNGRPTSRLAATKRIRSGLKEPGYSSTGQVQSSVTMIRCG
jgi:hypothetical protein